jgi:hypothetical protein
VLLSSLLLDETWVNHPGIPPRAINASWNTTGKLACRVQFDQTFVGEEPGDQKSHILEYSVREITSVADVRV